MVRSWTKAAVLLEASQGDEADTALPALIAPGWLPHQAAWDVKPFMVYRSKSAGS
jgi:hypothetical protein